MARGRARTWLALVAIALSLPGAGLCAAAAATIAWSIATEPGYRHLFGAYGVRMLVLEVAWLAGIVGLALLATGRLSAASRARRTTAAGIAIAGALAAVVLEVELWPDAEFPLERGVFALPYLAWLACGAWFGRGREAASSA